MEETELEPPTLEMERPEQTADELEEQTGEEPIQMVEQTEKPEPETITDQTGMEVETVTTLTQIVRIIIPHQMAEVITLRVQITATIRDQTEVITPGIITVGTSTRETVIAGVIIEEVIMVNVMAVSYTHLDVYKRQVVRRARTPTTRRFQ